MIIQISMSLQYFDNNQQHKHCDLSKYMNKIQNNECQMKTDQKLKARVKLEYKNKQFTDNMMVEIKNNQIGLIRDQTYVKQGKQQNKTEKNSLSLFLKFINVLSVAKHCKAGDSFKIIIFLKAEQEQQEFEDSEQQQIEETEQSLQRQILVQLSSKNSQKHIEIKGRLVLTLQFSLNSSENKQLKSSQKASNVQQLEKKIKEGLQRENLVLQYQKLYQKIVTKLIEIDAAENQQNEQNGNNNKGIFNLLNSQNNEEFEQMANQGDEDDEWIDSHEIQDEFQKEQNL